MKDSLLVHETYLRKRPAFKHEIEYRLLIADNSLYIEEDLSSFGVKFKIDEQVKEMTADEIIDYLTEKICTQRANWNRDSNNNIRIEDAEDISEFLDGVMVHPLASQWYVDIIQDICKKRKIKFDEQPEIYILK